MRSKKKLVIAITSLISVFAISIVAVVAIFAAQNQSVTSNLTIRYTAVDVAATVRANYIVGNVVTPMLTDDGEEELVFLPTSSEGGTLSPEDEDIELDTNDSSVVFEYIFKNDSNSIDVAIDLDTTGFSTNNMTLSYAYSYERIENVSSMSTTEAFEPMMILGEAKEDGKYETLYVYVKMKVTNLANDASFEGTMDFSLTKATSVKLLFENTEDALNSRLMQTRIIPANTEIGSLPTPKFGDGEIYTWFEESALETLVSYPFTTSEDKVVYCGLAPYVATVMENGTTMIENVSEEPIYVATKTNGKFSFGASEYTNTDGAYVLLNEGQSVTVPAGNGANNVNFASPVSATNVVTNITLNTPVDLEEKMFYAAYGAYPQTYVGNALNEELKSTTLTPTGKSYTTDIDGTETILTEYSYGVKKYAKLENSLINGSTKFPTGSVAENGQIYFFYVEPIVAKAMQNNTDGTYAMMTVNILGSRVFNDWGTEEENGEFDNSWQNSDMRTYLNNTFLNESGLFDIAVEQSIANTDYFGTSPVNGNTIDKVWIASLDEILDWSGYVGNLDNFILGEFIEENDDARTANVSDMAFATSTYYVSYYGSGYYFLRSPARDNDVICGVIHIGYVVNGFLYNSSSYGFRPVFAVNV